MSVIHFGYPTVPRCLSVSLQVVRMHSDAIITNSYTTDLYCRMTRMSTAYMMTWRKFGLSYASHRNKRKYFGCKTERGGVQSETKSCRV